MERGLTIELMGTFRIRHQGEPISKTNSPRLQELLAWLLLNRDSPQPRQYIVFRFWPESSEKQARTNLRNLIYKVRKVLPDADSYLIINNNSIQWNTEASYTLDVEHFNTAIQNAKKADSDEARIIFLRQADGYYKNDLLITCYKKWIEPKRESLKKEHTWVLQTLVRLLENRRQYQMALPFAKKLIAKDEYDEAYYRQLMMLYARLEKRSKALEIYRECKKVLWDELKIEPAPKTKKLHERLKQAGIQSGSLTRIPQQKPGKFVGRVDAWNVLSKSWKEVLNGAARFVLIRGDPGIGKTRLSEEFLKDVQRSGYGAMGVRLYPETRNLSYGLATEFLSEAEKAGNLSTMNDVWQQELVRIMPGLKKKHPDLSEPGPILDDQNKQHFWQAMSEAVIGTKKPKMILLDDLHWADSDSLEWLAYLLHHNESHPLLIAATVRSVEFHQNKHVQNFVNQVIAENFFSEILLEPLDENETGELIQSIINNSSTSKTRQFIYRETEGNPLFIVEYLRQAIVNTGGKINTIQQKTGTRGGTGKIPKRVEAIISLRLSGLSKQARDLLGIAACNGRQFSLQILTEAAGFNKSIVEQTEELIQRKVIREMNNGLCDFTHSKFREVAYHKLSTARKKWNHRCIAEAIENVLVDEQKRYSSQLAFHYEKAENYKKSIYYYNQAALEARKVFSDQDIFYCTRALELLKKLPAGEERDRIEHDLLMNLGLSLTVYKGDGIEDLLKTSKRLKLISDRLDASTSVSVLFTLAFGKLISGQPTEAKQLIDKFDSTVNRLDDDKMYIESNFLLSLVNFQTGRISESIHYIQKGLSHYERVQSPYYSEYTGFEMGSVLNSGLSLLFLISGDISKSDEALKRASTITYDTNHSLSIHHFQYISAKILQVKGNVIETQKRAKKFIFSESEQRITYWHHFCEVYFGWALVRQKNYEEGITWIRKGIDNLSKDGIIWNLGYCYSLYAEAFALQGNLIKASSAIQEAFRQLEITKEGWYKAKAYHIKGKIFAKKEPENTAKAKFAFTKAVEIAQQQGAKLFEKQARISLDQLN